MVIKVWANAFLIDPPQTILLKNSNVESITCSLASSGECCKFSYPFTSIAKPFILITRSSEGRNCHVVLIIVLPNKLKTPKIERFQKQP
jgi:hypothetical protein